MKRKFKMTAAFFLAYIILNCGILGWIEVSHGTESRINSAQTVMAQIVSEPDAIRFSVLDTQIYIDTSFTQSQEWRVFSLIGFDPVVSGLYTALPFLFLLPF
ncbi:MAG: hypothetical protein J6B17_03980 [Ruminococcus sp.]|nr:hypothetical protein [Ruminococcus sp.]